MALSENEFQDVADEWLESLFELLESEDEEAALDIDLESGVMTITSDEDNVFLISKHAPSKQLWLSSPLSGGLHFDAADGGKDWALEDGRRLSIVLSEELRHCTSQEFSPNIL